VELNVWPSAPNCSIRNGRASLDSARRDRDIRRTRRTPSALCLGIAFAATLVATPGCQPPPCTARLCVQLFEHVSDGSPALTVTESEADSRGVIDLSQRRLAPSWEFWNHTPAGSHVERVQVLEGSRYQEGDHIRLLHDPQKVADVDAITADPAVQASVNLKDIPSDFPFPILQSGWDNQVAALQFKLNPGKTSRLRLDLHEHTSQVPPSLTLYDWESPNGSFSLGVLKFANRAQLATVTKGSGYHEGDHVRLIREDTSADTDVITVDPNVLGSVNLNTVKWGAPPFKPTWARNVAAFQFELNPAMKSHIRVDLTDQTYPYLTLYEWESNDAAGKITRVDLGHFQFAGKATHVSVTAGSAYANLDLARLYEAPSDICPSTLVSGSTAGCDVFDPKGSTVASLLSWAPSMVEIGYEPRLSVVADPYPTPENKPITLTVHVTDVRTGVPVDGQVRVKCGTVINGPFPTNAPFTVTLHLCRVGSEVQDPNGWVEAPDYPIAPIDFGF